MEVVVETKKCNICKLDLPLSAFQLKRHKNDRFYPASQCRKCRRKQEKSGPEYKARRAKRNRGRRARNNETAREKVILKDSTYNDNKHGLNNDLTEEFIKTTIMNGCSYCGTRIVRMTLDRIDNTLGHLQNNVRASCSDCNYTRGNMPFEAWMILVPAMRKARESGLLDGWVRYKLRPKLKYVIA